MPGPTPEFWQSKFETNHVPWDRGASSPQLARWLDEQTLKPCRIAVPGCGSGYEVVTLAARGFDVTGLDYAPAAVARTQFALAALNTQTALTTLAALAVPPSAGSSAGPTFHAEVVEADVLKWNPATPFDAAYEQTCLCALHPDHWVSYARQLHAWLKPGGVLLALFVQGLKPGASNGFVEGPPYHCDIHAMRALFDDTRWLWPKPPYARVPHPMGFAELAVVLTRR